MSRNVNVALLAEMAKPQICPVVLVSITFKTGTRYVWSGPGPLVWNGNTFLGVGSLGSIGAINGGMEVAANGTSVTLSGIDLALLGESMTDIQIGASAQIWFGAVVIPNTMIGTPYRVFRGTVDQPSVSVDKDKVSITLALETRMFDLQRSQQKRYTAGEQNLKYPNDSGFDWVEALSAQALRWGM